MNNQIIVRMLLCLAALVSLAATASAKTDSAFAAMFTDRVIGDTIPLYSANGSVEHRQDLHVYTFVDATSCFTCTMALRGVENWIEKSHANADIVVFVMGKGQEYVDAQKKRNGWNFTVVADPIYAYSSYYHVHVEPFFFVTDRSGTILEMDKCGGVHVSDEDIAKAYERATAAAATDRAATRLKSLARVEVTDSTGAPVVFSPTYYVLWSQHRSVILDGGMKYIYVVDTNGRVQRTWDMRRIPVQVVSPMEPSWAVGDSVILGADVSLSPAGRRVLYLFNVNSGSVEKINFNDSLLYSQFHVLTKPAYSAARNCVVVGLRPKPDMKAPAAMPTLLMCQRDGSFKTTGTPDTLFENNVMSTALTPLPRTDARGGIYEWQSPSWRVNVYNPDGSLVRTIYPHFGSQHRTFVDDMSNSDHLSLDYWVHYNASVSHSMYIFPGADGSEIDLVYLNTEYPPDVTDPLSSQARRVMFLHRMSGTGSPLDQDVRLPDACRPFYAQNGVVAAGELSGEHLTLAWYRIDPAHVQ
ncbi:MAG TPA: hypothetical protein VHI13_14565 [Candidatus Kapabacteria bacterium]|nr:hypothetical protein [Candidatus Kapabacteria bacterium]